MTVKNREQKFWTHKAFSTASINPSEGPIILERLHKDPIERMWSAMATLQPSEFMRFTGIVAGGIASMVEALDISPDTDEESLVTVIPMNFALAMAEASMPDGESQPMPPEPFANFLHQAALACRELAAPGADGMELPLRLGSQGAAAVVEGVHDVDYVRWSIYRTYIEVLLDLDPLPPKTETCAIQLFQSGLRHCGIT